MRGKKAKATRRWVRELMKKSETGDLLPVLSYDDHMGHYLKGYEMADDGINFKKDEHNRPIPILGDRLISRTMNPCLRKAVKEHKKIYRIVMRGGYNG